MLLLDNPKMDSLTSAGGSLRKKVEQARQQEWAELKVEISPQGSRLLHGWEFLRAFAVGETAHLSKPQLSLERSSPPLLGVGVGWGGGKSS